MPKDKPVCSTVNRLEAWRAVLYFSAYLLGLAGIWFVLLSLTGLAATKIGTGLGGHSKLFSFSVAPMSAVYLLGLYVILWLGISRFAQQHQLLLAPLQKWAVAVGFCAGLLLLVLLYGLFASQGDLRLTTPLTDWPWLLLQSLGLGLGIAWIEERLFRDLLLKWFCRSYTVPQAICLQALLFSLVHQLRGNWPLEQRCLSLVGLFLVGLLLGQVASRYCWSASVGLHAGWVAYCSFGEQVEVWSWEPATWLWHGAGNPVESLSGCLVFAGLNLLCWQQGPGLKNETESGLCSDTLQKPVS